MDTNITISNAESLSFDKSIGGFTGMIKGSDSKRLFDITLTQVNGTLVADLKQIFGKQDWDETAGESGEYVAEVVSHRIPMEEVAGGGSASESTGGKLPHYSGKSGDVSLALWRSSYNNTSLFAIFNDVDPEQVEAANDFFNAIEDDERNEQASTFFEQSEAGGESGRPDTSDAGEAEALAESLKLNGTDD